MSTPPIFQQAEFLAPTPAPAAFNSQQFTLALVAGLIGAIIGAIVYAAFITITHIEIGYLSIGVAFLVAWAMEKGSNSAGGRPYQISAVVLTLISVALGNALMLGWGIRKAQGPFPLSAHNVFAILRFGFEKPFLDFQDSGTGAALGLFILFIGLRAAWRMTSGIPGAVKHPFAR